MNIETFERIIAAAQVQLLAEISLDSENYQAQSDYVVCDDAQAHIKKWKDAGVTKISIMCVNPEYQS